MKVRVPDYYKDFRCIAGECTDTCCAGWQVDVDDESYAYYRTITGEFGERLHSVMIDGKNGEEGQFRIRDDGRCPFLNDNNLCDLYTALGEDALCVTCAQYPRFTTEYGNLKEIGIALSCKTAAALILRDNRRPGFELSENDEMFSSLNNIDGTLFMELMDARETAYDIAADRRYDIPQRMKMLLMYGQDLQKTVKHPDKFAAVRAKYSEKTRKTIAVDSLDDKRLTACYHEVWRCYMKQVIIKKEWPRLVKAVNDNLYMNGYSEGMKAFDAFYSNRQYEYENILTYFIYRYFMKAVFDRDILTKLKMAVISTMVIRHCDAGAWLALGKRLTITEQIEITHLYSREVEHSEENFDGLCRLFAHDSVFKTKNLIKIL